MGLRGIFSLVVRFEKKKLVLPVLMCLVLVSAVYGLYHVRGQGVDSAYMETTADAVFQSTAFATERTYFMNRSNVSKDYWQQREAEIDQRQENMADKRSSVVYYLAPVYAVYSTPLFPAVPDSPSYRVFTGENGNPFTLTFDGGMYLSREVPEHLLLILYRLEKIEDMRGELESGDITLEEYHDRLDRIDSKQEVDPEVLEQVGEYLEREDGSQSTAATVGALAELGTVREMRGRFLTDTVKEVRWYHYAPAFLATFSLYYLVSGAVLLVLRSFWKRLAGDPGTGSGLEIGEVS